ncbi:MAG: hydroxymethylglutaryl-CoA lyase [Spirochaetaceae bacterium]|nr:hydroxymethylglutaryl-CoA lyase [Spirochaetaceae bacterium]|tara:strand:- start:14094 stop:14993 length:900 start_codon:yes stop_codon:yes gene_type:complete
MNTVRICEVGPRDGLQNEKTIISPEDKVRFIELLAGAGIRELEATSFVRPGVIPQLSDAEQVFAAVSHLQSEINLPVLVPNVKGLQRAIEAGVRSVAVFTATSESFTKRNTNATVEESLERIRAIMKEADDSIRVRGYISTVVDCPYEGHQAPEKTTEIAKELLDLGCFEISLGETIGTAVPEDIKRLLDSVFKSVPAEKLAGHFHDTRGTALANLMAGLEMGLRSFDSSSGGMGGCPYAPGAAGNVATEDVVYALHRSGYETGIDLEALCVATAHIEQCVGRPSTSRVYQAMKAAGSR